MREFISGTEPILGSSKLKAPKKLQTTNCKFTGSILSPRGMEASSQLPAATLHFPIWAWSFF